MDIKSKASITVTAGLSAVEALAAVRHLPGFEAAVLDAVQAEAVKDATGLTFVSRGVTFADDGSSVVELVYEQAASTGSTVDHDADQSAEPGATPPAPASLPGLMIPTATA